MSDKSKCEDTAEQVKSATIPAPIAPMIPWVLPKQPDPSVYSGLLLKNVNRFKAENDKLRAKVERLEESGDISERHYRKTQEDHDALLVEIAKLEQERAAEELPYGEVIQAVGDLLTQKFQYEGYENWAVPDRNIDAIQAAYDKMLSWFDDNGKVIGQRFERLELIAAAANTLQNIAKVRGVRNSDLGELREALSKNQED